jgi:signal transduction histidine kinase
MNSAPSRWSLTARITALVFSAAVLLAVIAASAVAVAVDNRRQTSELVDVLSPARVNIDSLLIALIDQETAVRGYAVNGEADSLTPYTEGLTREKEAAAKLDQLLAGRSELLTEVHAIEAGAARWRTGVAEPIITDVRAGDLTAAQGEIDSSARQQFDEVRDRIARLQGSISAERAVAAVDVKAGVTHLVELLISAGVVILLTGILLFVALRVLVTRPVDRLAEDVRAVAGGDFTHIIHTDGPPELVDLGSGVDAMRQRILRDLDEVRQSRLIVEEANSRLESQADELLRSNRDLEQFAYVASHDLQEPLRKVASFCQLLQRRYAGQLDERADQYIAFAVDGAQRMQRLINDLLAFSRIGRVTTNFVEIDLNEIVAGAAAHHEQQLAPVGGRITWTDLPVIRGEEPLLTALVQNLISNSIKFQRPDTPPVIEFSARLDGDAWEISCVDNGIGIEPEFAEKVFVIFQRLHGKEAYPGTGIGLAVAKKIIEYHGGRIWVDSSVEAGTAIRFTLPEIAAPAPVSPAVVRTAEESVS